MLSKDGFVFIWSYFGYSNFIGGLVLFIYVEFCGLLYIGLTGGCGGWYILFIGLGTDIGAGIYVFGAGILVKNEFVGKVEVGIGFVGWYEVYDKGLNWRPLFILLLN